MQNQLIEFYNEIHNFDFSNCINDLTHLYPMKLLLETLDENQMTPS